MISFRMNRRCIRHGFTLMELMVAMAIAITMLVGTAQLMFRAIQQYQTQDQRQMLMQEAANAMEDVMSRPWESIASSEQLTLTVSPACRQMMPSAQMHVEVVPDRIADQKSQDDDTFDDVRRITVEVSLHDHEVRSVNPVRLVAWRFRTGEVTP